MQEIISQYPKPFIIKTLNRLWIEENFQNMIKTISENTTANITLNGESLNAVP